MTDVIAGEETQDLETETLLVHQADTNTTDSSALKPIPRNVISTLNSQLKISFLTLSKETAFTKAVIELNENTTVYVFHADTGKKILIRHSKNIDSGMGRAIVINNQGRFPWNYILSYVNQTEDLVQCSIEEIQNWYKNKQTQEIKTALDISAEIVSTEDDPFSKSIQLVNIYSEPLDLDAKIVEIDIEEQVTEPNFALMYRVPHWVFGSNKSQIITIYWDTDVLSSEENKDLRKSYKFAISDGTSPDSIFKQFKSNPIQRINLEKLFHSNIIDTKELIALTVEWSADIDPETETKTGTMYIEYKGMLIERPVRIVDGKTCFNQNLPKNVLSQFSRFEQRAFIAVLNEIKESQEISNLSAKDFEAKMKTKTEKLKENDIQEFIKFLTDNIQNPLFKDTKGSEIIDIAAEIKKRILASDENIQVEYSKSEEKYSRFPIASIKLSFTSGDSRLRVEIKKIGETYSVKAFNDKQIEIVDVVTETKKGITDKLRDLFSGKKDLPESDYEFVQQGEEISEPLEVYFSILSILDEGLSLSKEKRNEINIALNQKYIAANVDGIYATKVDVDDKPTEVIVVNDKLSMKLERRVLQNTIEQKEIWINPTSSSLTAKVIGEDKDFDKLTESNLRLQSKNVGLHLIQKKSDPRTTTIPLNNLIK